MTNVYYQFKSYPLFRGHTRTINGENDILINMVSSKIWSSLSSFYELESAFCLSMDLKMSAFGSLTKAKTDNLLDLAPGDNNTEVYTLAVVTMTSSSWCQ